MTVLEPTVEQLEAEREVLRDELKAMEKTPQYIEANYRRMLLRLDQIAYLLGAVE